MNKKLLMIVMVFSGLCINAQSEKGTQGVTQPSPSNGNTVVRNTSAKPYSYEKKANGITVQYYTQEQFDRLPGNRKVYYLQHKEQFKIIPTKK